MAHEHPADLPISTTPVTTLCLQSTPSSDLGRPSLSLMLDGCPIDMSSVNQSVIGRNHTMRFPHQVEVNGFSLVFPAGIGGGEDEASAAALLKQTPQRFSLAHKAPNAESGDGSSDEHWKVFAAQSCVWRSFECIPREDVDWLPAGGGVDVKDGDGVVTGTRFDFDLRRPSYMRPIHSFVENRAVVVGVCAVGALFSFFFNTRQPSQSVVAVLLFVYGFLILVTAFGHALSPAHSAESIVWFVRGLLVETSVLVVVACSRHIFNLVCVQTVLICAVLVIHNCTVLSPALTRPIDWVVPEICWIAPVSWMRREVGMESWGRERGGDTRCWLRLPACTSAQGRMLRVCYASLLEVSLLVQSSAQDKRRNLCVCACVCVCVCARARRWCLPPRVQCCSAYGGSANSRSSSSRCIKPWTRTGTSSLPTRGRAQSWRSSAPDAKTCSSGLLLAAPHCSQRLHRQPLGMVNSLR
jgi:hypothetical protein